MKPTKYVSAKTLLERLNGKAKNGNSKIQTESVNGVSKIQPNAINNPSNSTNNSQSANNPTQSQIEKRK